jgi:hypothetical protein
MKRVVLAGLTFAWVLAGCAESSTEPGLAVPVPKPPPEDDDLFAMVPAEADLVLWADLRILRSSPWTRDSFARMADNESGESLEQMRDLDRVMFAKVPFLRDGATVLIAQGNPERERMSRVFAGGGAVDRSTYRAAEMLVRGEEALAFVGKRTVISGLTVAVRTAIDCNIGVSRAIDNEPWFQRMRRQLARAKGDVPPVAALYVKLQPATREALKNEMGEGEFLEEFAARIDLGNDLDAVALGNVRTELQARDFAARLAERVRDARTRPIVAAFGFGSVLDAMRFSAKDTTVEATLHISQRQRAEIVDRMAIVADTMAAMRKNKNLETRERGTKNEAKK